MPTSLLYWEISLILALQGLGDWLAGPMNAITLTGSTEFFVLILPALYWCWDSRLGIRVGIGLLASTGLNTILKIALHDPRPYWLDARVRLLTSPYASFGLPSGHAQNSVVMWGILGAYLRRAWTWVAMAALILLVGLSRIYLGVHFPTDVLAGWAVGAVLLVLVVWLERPAVTWMQRLGKELQVAAVGACSLAAVAIGALVSGGVHAAWQVPGAWAQNAATAPFAPLAIDDLVLSAGTLFGLATGSILAGDVAASEGSWAQRLGRYLVGLVGILVLWKGVGALFSMLVPDQGLVGQSLRYARYVLIGLWVSAAAPRVFVRLGLAAGEEA